MAENPLVSIVMGSDSDLEIMNEAAKVMDDFGIAYEIDVASAHRSPARTSEYARNASELASGRDCAVMLVETNSTQFSRRSSRRSIFRQ